MAVKFAQINAMRVEAECKLMRRYKYAPRSLCQRIVDKLVDTNMQIDVDDSTL